MLKNLTFVGSEVLTSLNLWSQYRPHKFNILLFYFISIDILIPRSIFINIILIGYRKAYVRIYVFYMMLKTDYQK